jgi:hypothetical protein
MLLILCSSKQRSAPQKFQVPYKYTFVCLLQKELSLRLLLCISLHLLKVVVGVATLNSMRVRIEG